MSEIENTENEGGGGKTEKREKVEAIKKYRDRWNYLLITNLKTRRGK